jgi:hypothetical protein
MSPQECIDRATGAYVAGLLPLAAMELYVTMALEAEQAQREVDYMRTLSLPFPWTIAAALAA